jgi:tRNA(Ile2) C34 agmatinyltransferase TiaS
VSIGWTHTIYVLAVLVGLAIFALATIVSPRPQRPCPRCDVRIAVAARRCRSCGYEPA